MNVLLPIIPQQIDNMISWIDSGVGFTIAVIALIGHIWMWARWTARVDAKLNRICESMTSLRMVKDKHNSTLNEQENLLRSLSEKNESHSKQLSQIWSSVSLITRLDERVSNIMSILDRRTDDRSA